MEKVFITGATGVLGKRVAARLIRNGFAVVGLSRSRENHELLKGLGATPVAGDLFDVKDMIRCSKECTAILHLATHIPNLAMPNKKHHWAMNDRIRTEGTRVLLDAARHNGIKRFVQQSLTALYGNKNGTEVNSHSPIADDQPFMLRSAAEMEKLLRQAPYLDHQILRFAQFYSEDSFTTQQLIQAVRKGKMPIIGKGANYWNAIHVDDAASAVVYAFLHFERLKNQTINFSDFAPMQARHVLNGLADMTGSKKPPQLPSFLARLFLNRSLYKYLTASFKIIKDERIKDWQPKYKNYLQGMEHILSQKKPA